MAQTRILVVEDDPAARRTMARLLKGRGYEVIVAEDGRNALELLDPGIHLALVDWMLPEMDGVELCRRVKDATSGQAYVIMITSRTEKSDIVHALDQGADDYMTAPVNHDELVARVRAGERIATRERELAEAYDELRSEADRDPLTGLVNRRCFDDLLRRHIQHSGPGAVALLMIDLDRFKRVNDTYGHQVGDEVLREVAEAVSAAVRRDVDVAARYGGDEIAVITPDTSVFCARELADRIRRQVAQLRVPADGGLVSVTVSVGVAMFDAEMAAAPEPAVKLVEAADTRLYQAKHRGRNRVAA
ncbi:MAG: GGDEF domain-containing response regulator [Armatimonadota bacterium]